MLIYVLHKIEILKLKLLYKDIVYSAREKRKRIKNFKLNTHY